MAMIMTMAKTPIKVRITTSVFRARGPIVLAQKGGVKSG
jgi:hypothetical protein